MIKCFDCNSIYNDCEFGFVDNVYPEMLKDCPKCKSSNIRFIKHCKNCDDWKTTVEFKYNLCEDCAKSITGIVIEMFNDEEFNYLINFFKNYNEWHEFTDEEINNAVERNEIADDIYKLSIENQKHFYNLYQKANEKLVVLLPCEIGSYVYDIKLSEDEEPHVVKVLGIDVRSSGTYIRTSERPFEPGKWNEEVFINKEKAIEAILKIKQKNNSSNSN